MKQEKQKIIGLEAIGRSGMIQQRSKLLKDGSDTKILLQDGLLLRVDILRSQAYMVNGMSFSVDLELEAFSARYSKSAYSKTGLSASVQHVMGAHDIKVGFDYNQHTLRQYSANPSVMKYFLSSVLLLIRYGHNGYGSFDDIPAYEWRTYIDGYGYDHEGNEIDDRKVLYW